MPAIQRAREWVEGRGLQWDSRMDLDSAVDINLHHKQQQQQQQQQRLWAGVHVRSGDKAMEAETFAIREYALCICTRACFFISRPRAQHAVSPARCPTHAALQHSLTLNPHVPRRSIHRSALHIRCTSYFAPAQRNCDILGRWSLPWTIRHASPPTLRSSTPPSVCTCIMRVSGLGTPAAAACGGASLFF